jgi:hypothetical protein
MIFYSILMILSALEGKQCKIHVKYSIILGYFTVILPFWIYDGENMMILGV